ncbi:MAG TPA: galactokinase [Pyrinomonadaceae bacterium]|nr:galactokinase [Pyrinomonadaceae bacterium]
MINLEQLRSTFRETYNREPRVFRAPGRVNLIGEHVDYNDGFVLPMAIDREAVVAAAPRRDSLFRIYALDVNDAKEFDLNDEPQRLRGTWLDYIEGTIRLLKAKFPKLTTGADICFSSSVPIGAGLSSSAALEISAGFAVLTLNEIGVNRIVLARAAQQAEHEFVGAKIGIMDQLTSALGRAGHALLIDCRLLDTKPIPLNFKDVQIVVCDSGVKHDLATSEYNTRREECEQGLQILRTKMPGVRALRDVSSVDFEKYRALLPETIRSRCRHVISEIKRTVQAAEMLKFGRADSFGKLMYESHVSLRDDYAVSSPELDFLVETARSLNGVFGARMTGGGFGGCTVNLVGKSAVNEFQETIRRGYETRFGFAPKIYVVEASDGASEIKISATQQGKS